MGGARTRLFVSFFVWVDTFSFVVLQCCTGMPLESFIQSNFHSVRGVILHTGENGTQIDDEKGRPAQWRKHGDQYQQSGCEGTHKTGPHVEGDLHGSVQELGWDPSKAQDIPSGSRDSDETNHPHQESVLVSLTLNHTKVKRDGHDEGNPERKALFAGVVLQKSKLSRAEVCFVEAAQNDKTKKKVKWV